MSGLGNYPFLKMNGLGNEIVILDLRGSTHVVTEAEARAVAAGPGSHFDQLMALHDPATPRTDAFMRIYNTDGSLAEACGNGTRCVAWTMLRGSPKRSLRLETKAGLVACERLGEWLRGRLGGRRGGHGGLKQGGFHPLSEARAVAVVKRSQDGEGSKDPRIEI